MNNGKESEISPLSISNTAEFFVFREWIDDFLLVVNKHVTIDDAAAKFRYAVFDGDTEKLIRQSRWYASFEDCRERGRNFAAQLIAAQDKKPEPESTDTAPSGEAGDS